MVGVDVSDEMIRQARAASKDFDNILYVWGSAQQIPWEENFFDKMLSVESFYYYPDQERALAELFRVMAPRGRMFILINLYKDNPYSLQWVDKLKVPVHVRSEAEYIDLLKKHGFENVEAQRIPDDTPTPDDYQTKSFNSLEDLRAFKRIGGVAADGIETRCAHLRAGQHDLLVSQFPVAINREELRQGGSARRVKLELPAGSFEAYLFDCDGTIVDSMPLHYIAWKKALGEWNCTFDEQLFYAWGGLPVAEIISLLNQRQRLSMSIEGVSSRKREPLYGSASATQGDTRGARTYRGSARATSICRCLREHPGIGDRVSDFGQASR